MTARRQILSEYLHIRDDARVDALPESGAFWSDLASGKLPQLDQGRLLSAFTFSEPWPTWERHPAGEELVLLLSGAATLVLEEDGHENSVELMAPGDYVLVPAGTWHTARTAVETALLFLTPGAGTEHRPADIPQPADARTGTPSFRSARSDDLPELVRMLADDPLGAGREHFSQPLAEGYVEAFASLQRDPNNDLVVAVLDGVVVGMLQVTFIPGLTYQGRWRALVEGVRVSSAFRSRGIGAAMIRWTIELARSRGCVMVQLTTDRARDEALRFYEALGFVASHHGMKLHL